MCSERSEDSWISLDIVPFLHEQYGYPDKADRVKIKEVPIYSPSGGTSASKPDIVYYHNGEPLLVVEAKKKPATHEQALKEAIIYHKNFPTEDKKWAPSGLAPRFLATVVEDDIKFYSVELDTIDKIKLITTTKEIDPLNWDGLLDKYGLKLEYVAKKLDRDSFRKDVLNALASIFILSKDKIITPAVIQLVSEQIVKYLEAYDKNNYQNYPPYTILEKEPKRQKRMQEIFRIYNLIGSSGPELAKEFRNFVVRAFQGNEFNQYMTEDCVIRFMCELVGDVSAKAKMLDYECGSGGFIVAAKEKWDLKLENMKGVDIAPLPCIVAKAYIALCFKLKGNQIKNIPIERDNGLFPLGNDWDLVLSNPAGDSRYPPDAEKGQKQTDIDKTYELPKVLKYLERDLNQNMREDKYSEYNFSIQQAIRSCKMGGKICLILPEGVFSNSQDEILRKYIVKHCKIYAIISLPRGVFKKGTSGKSLKQVGQTAQMKMTILYAEKVAPVIDKSGVGLTGINIDYPIFLVAISKPDETSGEIEDWLKPRLYDVLEQWKSWQKTGELTKPSFKEVETSKPHVQETMIKKADKKEVAKPSKPQHKSTHKVDEHLKGFFRGK